MVPKDEDFCLSKTVFEINHVESRRPSLKGESRWFWIPHMADLYVLERPKTKIFIFERQKSALCGGFSFNNSFLGKPKIVDKLFYCKRATV